MENKIIFRYPLIILGNRKRIRSLLKQIEMLNDLVIELKDKNEELARKLHGRKNRRTVRKTKQDVKS